MYFIHKIIMIVIFAILFYILFRLVKKRTEILRGMEQPSVAIEGLTCISEITDATVKKIMDANKIVPIQDNLSSKKYYKDDTSRTLDKYHIKASYHSAFDGTKISKDMLLYVLHCGYRFLDFEVYYDYDSGDKRSLNNKSKTAVVSYNDGSTISSVTVALKDILETINIHAFSNVNNKDDPLFIQIRPVYGKEKGENDLLDSRINTAITIIDNAIKDVTRTTTMSSLLKKTVVIINNFSSPPNYMKQCNAESELEKCTLDKSKNQVIIQVTPTDSKNKILSSNPQSLDIISKTNCHICPMMAWKPSYTPGLSSFGALSQLGDYETMFLKTAGSAFVLLTEAKAYSDTNNPLNVHGSSYP